ncbi:MAG: TIGR04222 domain-containing membrane protein [Magnetococcales bacterium]|nr:TIGR04222 domain-containing membrane protein [Magnetococcales bacterium]
MIRMFEQIPGQDFLFYFFILSIFLVIISWYLTRMDRSWIRMSPSPNTFDADTLAYLVGGNQHVVRTSIFRLWRYNLLGKVSTTPLTEPLSLIDQTTLQGLAGNMPTQKNVRTIAGLLQPQTTPLARRLESAGLLFHDGERKRRRTFAALTALPLWGIGGTKFILGIINHKPIIFIFLLLIITQLLIILIINSMGVRTTLGRKFLKQTRDHFAWLRSQHSDTLTDSGIDLALGAALFGLVFWQNFPSAGDAFGMYQPRAGNTLDGGWSSDGGSDFSGSSGDGGGGCGGCGGCGGGD